jgi:hypothetical protein
MRIRSGPKVPPFPVVEKSLALNISFTLSTVPLLALAAYLVYRAKGQLLPVVMFMSVFQAASIVNVGLGGVEIGVGPCYFLLLIAIAKGIKTGKKRQQSNNPPVSATVLITSFVLYAVASAFICPFLFKGVLISNPKLGIDVPLEWGTGHLNQLVYLAMSFCLYLVATYGTSPAELTKSLNWFIGGAVLASFIAMYQFASMKTGLPFPSEYLHTGNYAIFEAYEIDGFPRMDSTFTEASAAAFTFTVALALALWRLLSGNLALKNVTNAAVILIGLLLTLSTTGYICLIYLGSVAAGIYLFRWKGRPELRVTKLLLGLPILLAIFILFGITDVRESIVKLAHTVLLDKTASSSYTDRTQMNVNAFNTAVATDWFGAGWGICRASSIIPTMLGNVGIPGLALFCAFCFGLLRPALKPRSIKLPIHGAVLFALGAVLVVLVVAGPQLDFPVIWVLFAVAAKLAFKGPVKTSLVFHPRFCSAESAVVGGQFS